MKIEPLYFDGCLTYQIALKYLGEVIAEKQLGAVVEMLKIEGDEHVEIGEKDNICVLTKSEWEAPIEKILSRETWKRATMIPLEPRLGGQGGLSAA